MKALDSSFFFSFFLEISMYVCWYKSVQTYIPIYTKYQSGKSVHRLPAAHPQTVHPSKLQVKNSLAITHQQT